METSLSLSSLLGICAAVAIGNVISAMLLWWLDGGEDCDECR